MFGKDVGTDLSGKAPEGREDGLSLHRPGRRCIGKFQKGRRKIHMLAQGVHPAAAREQA